MTELTHQADDSFIGFVFQGLYALLLLYDAKDDEAVSVETEDDVVLKDGATLSLYQLKHSLGIPPKLTVKNVGFWKTIRIWTEKKENISSCKFVFVTCAEIASKSSLTTLSTSAIDRSAVVKELEEEAVSVLEEIEAAKKAKKPKLPHQERKAGCEAYLELTPQQREALVSRITIRPNSFNAGDITSEVVKRLSNSVVPEKREALAESLIQWWDRRVTLALLKKRPSLITKDELLTQIHSFIKEHYQNSLPDDFSLTFPATGDLSNELGGMMEKQIELVKGGANRIRRAAEARWQARNQRAKWLREDISIASTLADFDDLLVKEWGDLHGPLCDDLVSQNCSEDILCQKGRDLLDWSHAQAPLQISLPKKDWNAAFLVRGSYQQLADELKVGWHPNFVERLSEVSDNK